MKLAYPVVTPDCTIPMMAFSCGDFNTHLSLIKRCGYEGVELLIRDPGQINFKEILLAVKNAGLSVAAIASSPIPSQDKIFLAHDNKEIRNEALRRGKELLNLCGSINVPLVIGRFRGNINENNSENSMEAFTNTFSILEETCLHTGDRIALEVQSPSKVNTFHRAKETLNWIQNHNFQHIGPLLDTFHMELSEPSLSAALTCAGEKLEFVHLSDSRRLVPGAGNISFKEILDTLKFLPYKGWLSIEVKQWPDSLTAARLSAEFLKYINAEEYFL